jgi:hypothetical protein
MESYFVHKQAHTTPVVVYPDFPELYSPHPNSEYTLNPALSFGQQQFQQVSVSSKPVVYPLSDGLGYDVQTHTVYVRPPPTRIKTTPHPNPSLCERPLPP